MFPKKSGVRVSSEFRPVFGCGGLAHACAGLYLQASCPPCCSDHTPQKLFGGNPTLPFFRLRGYKTRRQTGNNPHCPTLHEGSIAFSRGLGFVCSRSVFRRLLVKPMPEINGSSPGQHTEKSHQQHRHCGNTLRLLERRVTRGNRDCFEAWG
jgi:hypothetical protein